MHHMPFRLLSFKANLFVFSKKSATDGVGVLGLGGGTLLFAAAAAVTVSFSYSACRSGCLDFK